MTPIDTKTELAILLHESGRAAVEQRKVVRDDLPVLPFIEWKDLSAPAREGRLLMADYLLKNLDKLLSIIK